MECTHTYRRLFIYFVIFDCLRLNTEAAGLLTSLLGDGSQQLGRGNIQPNLVSWIIPNRNNPGRYPLYNNNLGGLVPNNNINNQGIYRPYPNTNYNNINNQFPNRPIINTPTPGINSQNGIGSNPNNQGNNLPSNNNQGGNVQNNNQGDDIPKDIEQGGSQSGNKNNNGHLAPHKEPVNRTWKALHRRKFVFQAQPVRPWPEMRGKVKITTVYYLL